MRPFQTSAPDENAIREGFIRQRRNLIIVSLVLLFAESSELTINKLNVLGNELSIVHPVVVLVALVVAYIYWLYRYYVYFRDTGEKGFAYKFGGRLSVLVDRWARTKIVANNSRWQEMLKEAIERTMKVQAGNVELQKVLHSSSDWRFADASPIGPQRFSAITAQARLQLYGVRNNSPSQEYETPAPFAITGIQAFLLNSRAAIHVLVHTRIFSEYYLPFLIALAPPAYWLWEKCA